MSSQIEKRGNLEERTSRYITIAAQGGTQQSGAGKPPGRGCAQQPPPRAEPVPRELTLDVHLLIKHSATHLARRPALANFFPSREGAVLLSGIIESAYSDFWQPWRATLPATYLENPGLWWSMPGTFARTIRAVEAPITGYHALNISYEATGLGQYIREEHARFV